MTLAGRFRKRPFDFLSDLARDYGDIVFARMGPYRFYFLNHPELIRELLVTKARSFQRMRRQKRVLSKIDGNGLILSEGEFWRRQRRMMQPAFHPQRLEQYGPTMSRCIRRMVDRWEEGLRTGGDREIEISGAMTDLALEIIAGVLFSVDVSEEATSLGQAVSVLSEASTWEAWQPLPVPDWLPIPIMRRRRRALRILDETIRGIIRDRRRSGEDKGDLLSKLLLAVDEEGSGGGMTNEQARDEAVVLFLAGHDTTGAGLAWTWYLLAQHPEVQESIAEELERALPSRPGRRPEVEDLPHLSFTELVVKESLRLYPPAWGLLAREAAEDVELGGYSIRKGAIVHVFPWITHRDPRWFPDPERFDPRRFAPPREEQIPQYAYFPFGGGPRSCIGNGLAMMEMSLIVASVVQRFHVSLAPGQQKPEPVPVLSLRPGGGLRVSLRRREAVATSSTFERSSA